jgi:hypothetical protein
MAEGRKWGIGAVVVAAVVGLGIGWVVTAAEGIGIEYFDSRVRAIVVDELAFLGLILPSVAAPPPSVEAPPRGGEVPSGVVRGLFNPDEIQMVSLLPHDLHERPAGVLFLATDKNHNIFVCGRGSPSVMTPDGRESENWQCFRPAIWSTPDIVASSQGFNIEEKLITLEPTQGLLATPPPAPDGLTPEQRSPIAPDQK